MMIAAGRKERGLPPHALPNFIEKVRNAWRESRDGKPRIVGLVYFVITGSIVVIALVVVARTFGRDE